MDDYSALAQALDFEAFNKRIERIRSGLENPDETFHKRRQAKDLEQLLEAECCTPREDDSDDATKGLDLTARARGKFPLSSVKGTYGHMPMLLQELRSRHILPYLPFGPCDKRVHPVPERENMNQTVEFIDSKRKPVALETMGMTMMKDLLMVDEERLFQMQDQNAPDRTVRGHYKAKYKAYLGNSPEKVEFDLEVPLRERSIAQFDHREFTILDPAVEFKAPEET